MDKEDVVYIYITCIHTHTHIYIYIHGSWTMSVGQASEHRARGIAMRDNALGGIEMKNS